MAKIKKAKVLKKAKINHKKTVAKKVVTKKVSTKHLVHAAKRPEPKEKPAVKLPSWNFSLFYDSANDPQIERDVLEFEKLCSDFAAKYDIADKAYLRDEGTLALAMKDYEAVVKKSDAKPLMYFYFIKDIDASNNEASAKLSLLQNRLAKCGNAVAFFGISLGNISEPVQKAFLNSQKLVPYRIFLERIFSDARYTLSVAEEKILNLKSLPANEMWVSANQRILNMKTVTWKKKAMPIAGALNMIQQMPTAKLRSQLSKSVTEVLKTVAPFSEAEINAVVTDKKIEDDLRGFKTPYENTVRGYRNDPAVIERLVKTVTANFPIAHRFYALKAKLLKQKHLSYSDRAAKIGMVKTKFPFEDSVLLLKKALNDIDPKYSKILDSYLDNGQIDVGPKVGKASGAYCASTYENPTFVLLNHSNDLHSFQTLAHEMGHTFHGELSRLQGPLYYSHSTALAETASTLFETIASDAIFETLSEADKIVALHDSINDNIATIFRQIACFNFESDIHETIRQKGFMSKEELADAHNKNMSAYLGPVFKLDRDDGYMFVQWSHIRRFFYVYSYAFGQLVSKALLRRYRADKSFWSSIEKFLSAGGKESPENILKEIGIDIAKPDFWMDGLREIEADIERLEKLTGK